MLGPDGSADAGFNPGTGANVVNGATILPNGQIVIGGGFSSFNGQPASRIARINLDGSLDTSFNTGAGSDGIVHSVLLLPDNDIVIGGSFSYFQGSAANSLARINPDGSRDAEFGPSELSIVAGRNVK
ncbi:MAG: delta-60 repeat domain-containing protein [Verrucomicrobiales bacterium]